MLLVVLGCCGPPGDPGRARALRYMFGYMLEGNGTDVAWLFQGAEEILRSLRSLRMTEGENSFRITEVKGWLRVTEMKGWLRITEVKGWLRITEVKTSE